MVPLDGQQAAPSKGQNWLDGPKANRPPIWLEGREAALIAHSVLSSLLGMDGEGGSREHEKCEKNKSGRGSAL